MHAYPSFFGDDSPRNDLEVVHVEDVLQRRTGCQRSLPCLLFLSNLLDRLHDRAGVDDAEANSRNESRVNGTVRSTAHCFSTGKLVVIASGG